jgi:multimeric flavodoxin WrbA
MKRIVAINGSPRKGWNTDMLVREAAKGAESNGAEAEVIDLFKLAPYTGCVSCFGCKTPGHLGQCVYKDGLAPALEKIRSADGLIIGSPIYLGNITASARALYERLIFQYITYKTEPKSYDAPQMPVLLIFTSNCAEEYYAEIGYDKMVEGYRAAMESRFGSAKVLISGDTLQVNDYDKWNWTMFNPDEKRARRESVFPNELKAAFDKGAEMVLK